MLAAKQVLCTAHTLLDTKDKHMELTISFTQSSSMTRLAACMAQTGCPCQPWVACLQDAERLESLAKGLSSPADLKPAAEGTELQSLLGNIAERAQGGTEFLYTKFFAIGLFRLLELTGALGPQHRALSFCCHCPTWTKMYALQLLAHIVWA